MQLFNANGVLRLTAEGLDLLEAAVREERDQETKEQRTARRLTHDPSWDEGRRQFLATLRKYGLGYDRVVAYARFVQGYGSPSTWTGPQRQLWLSTLVAGGYPTLLSIEALT